MCGIPLLYMELAVGQFTKRGPIGALSKLCPILKGNLSIEFIVYPYVEGKVTPYSSRVKYLYPCSSADDTMNLICASLRESHVYTVKFVMYPTP